MTNAPYVRAVMAQATLEFVPPLIRNSLIGESTFRQEYGFQTEAIIALGDSGLSIPGGRLAVVERLVETGARTDVVERQFGATAAGWAAHGGQEHGGQEEVVRFLEEC